MATPAGQTFVAVLHAGHKQAAAPVPFDPARQWQLPAVALWPGRRGHRVHVSAAGQAFDSAIVARASRHWLLVDDAVRDTAGWSIGDAIAFTVAPARPTP